MATESSQQLLENRLFSHFRGWIWSERGRDTSSWLWDEGYDIQKDSIRRWVCKTCVHLNRPPISSFTAAGLQNARTHLWRSHRIGAPESEKKCNAQLQDEGITGDHKSITSIFKLDPQQPQQQQFANSLVRSFDRRHLQRILVELIVGSNLPFSFVDNPRFRELLEYLNPSVALRRAIPSSSSIRRLILQEYKAHCQKVIDVLHNCPGKIYISFDGWTSPNQFALYGIVCFYRNEAGKPCKLLLGVPEAHRHFGATIAGEVLDVLHAFGIDKKKIGYFTLDNAENNSTAMEVIGAELGFNGRLRRGRCIGHTINLAAKALLFGHHPDAFEKQLTGAVALTDADYQQWRSTGPVGKLHNLVVDLEPTELQRVLIV
ncbi:restless-like transposase [Apiospora arundinis]